MGFGIYILTFALWFLGWVVWTSVLKIKAPHFLFQFGLAFAGAFLVWHAIIFYPVFDLRNSLSYSDVIRIIEEKSKVRFNPDAQVVDLGGGNDLAEGLQSCGDLCSRGYCEGRLKQKFIFYVKTGHLGMEKNGIQEWLPPQNYIQYYSGKCPNEVIMSEKNSLKSFPIEYFKYLPNIEIEYNKIYKALRVKFKITTYNFDKSFSRAHFVMDKKNSWLEGLSDDSSGYRDVEEIMDFTWLDVMRVRK